MQFIKTSNRVLCEEHPDTLSSMHDFAFTLRSSGQDTEAIRLVETCVQLRTLVLGADHPDTLSSSASLRTWQTEDEGNV